MPPPDQGCNFGGPDRGPAINLTNWMCVVAVVLLVVLKILKRVIENIRAITRQSFEPCDYLIFAALAASLARSVIVSRQVMYGLGKGGIISTKLILYEEFEYASRLLFLLNLLLSKLALLCFLYPHVQGSLRFFWGLVSFTGTWWLGATLVTAFQCPLPRPYLILNPKCLNQWIVGITIEGLDILDEIGLIAFSLYLIYGMKMTKTRKSITTFFFAIRVAVFPLIALRIMAIYRTYSEPHSRIIRAGSVAISSGVYMNISLIITTIQCMLSIAPSNNRRSASFVGIPSFYALPPQVDQEKQVAMNPLSRLQTGKASLHATSLSNVSSRKPSLPPARPPRPGSLALPDGMLWTVVRAKNRAKRG